MDSRIHTCVEERLCRGLQAHLCPFVRITKRRFRKNESYFIGLSFTPGLEIQSQQQKFRVDRFAESMQYTFVKAVQPTPMINTRSLSATMAVLKRLSEPLAPYQRDQTR